MAISFHEVILQRIMKRRVVLVRLRSAGYRGEAISTRLNDADTLAIPFKAGYWKSCAGSCAIGGTPLAGLLSKSLLKAFVDAFVAKSASLQFGAFTRSRMAQVIFPNQKPQHAKSHFTECYSPTCARPLNVADLQATLDACRTLLRQQYQIPALSELNPDARVIDFEKILCSRLAIGATGHATVDDFRIDRQFECATTPLEFEIPDALEWDDGDFDFAARLKATQNHGIEVLEEVVPRIVYLSDDEQRLRLFQVAVSALAVNHPGTRYHNRATDLALTAAGHAQLLRLVNGPFTPDSLRARAIRLAYCLSSNCYAPRLDSPTNYLRYALSGQRMPASVWKGVRVSVEQSIVDIQRFVEIDPANPQAILDRSSVLSMKARFLAVLGEDSAWHDADQLHRVSLKDIERLPQPYGFIYPILKDILRSKVASAIRRCEEASTILEKSGNLASLAFAALLVILTERKGGNATVDNHFRQQAMKALSSPAIQYKYSHIFDAATLRSVLRKLPTVSSTHNSLPGKSRAN